MDDQSLLARFVSTGDASAFEELTRRYAAMVKAVCVHVLGNTHDAEEVTQECFFELARHADDIHTSLGGWLHRAATSRSLNALRSRARRAVREREVGLHAETASPAVDITKSDLHRIINGALTELPDELRVPMMLHFFGGRSQRDVAIQLGVNQSTICRRMRDALEQLREKLTRAGYAAAAPAMMVLMQEHAVTASESGLSNVDATETAAKIASGTTLATTAKGFLTAIASVFSYLVFGGWASLAIAVGTAVYIAKYQPKWFSELMASLGSHDIYHQPTFFLRRWIWTLPPDGWRKEIGTSFCLSAIFFGLAIAFALGTPMVPWGTVAFATVVAAVYFIHAARLIHRVKNVSGQLAEKLLLNSIGKLDQQLSIADRYPPASRLTWFDTVQLTLIGAAGIGVAISSISRFQMGTVWPAVLMTGTISLTMLFSGIRHGMRHTVRLPNVTNIERYESVAVARSHGTRTFVAIGTILVVGLSFWIVWNPSAVRGLSLSLAAIQTSILGWMFYRLASSCRAKEPRLVFRVVIAVLSGCFVLNSSVCFANWLR